MRTYVVVNDIQPVQSSIRGIEQRAEETETTEASNNLPLGCILEIDGVTAHSDYTFHKGKCRVDTEKEEIEEQKTDPVNSTRKSAKHDGPGSKNEREPTVVKVFHIRFCEFILWLV